MYSVIAHPDSWVAVLKEEKAGRKKGGEISHLSSKMLTVLLEFSSFPDKTPASGSVLLLHRSQQIFLASFPLTARIIYILRRHESQPWKKGRVQPILGGHGIVKCPLYLSEHNASAAGEMLNGGGNTWCVPTPPSSTPIQNLFRKLYRCDYILCL